MNFIKLLKAMSFSRAEIKQKISGKGEQFTAHCAKILETTKPETIKSMSDELYDFSHKIMGYTLSYNKKHLSKKIILEDFFAYADTQETFATLLRHYRIKYHKIDDNSKDGEKFLKYNQFIDKVSDELSQLNMTKDKMYELVKQFLL